VGRGGGWDGREGKGEEGGREGEGEGRGKGKGCGGARKVVCPGTRAGSRRACTQHAISLSLLGKSVRVVCDDTDVFVLLVHFYISKCKGSNAAPMIMSSPMKQRAVVDIRATAEAHSDIADDLLAIH